MEPTFVEAVDGVRLATWDLGSAGRRPSDGDDPRPALLVAHATGFHSRCYRALAAALSDRFRVVGLDFRGHGHSAAPPLDADDDGLVPAMGWDRFADDVLAVVDGLGLEGAFGFGHSSGGAALLLAEERRPGTLAAIYAYEPIVASPEAWAGFDARGFDPASAARRRRPVFASRAAALENFSSKPPLSSLRADVLVDYVEGGFVDRPDGAVGLRCHPDAEAATYAMAARNDAWAHLGDIACPVVVGCGGARADFGADLAAALAARVPRGRVDEHAEVGHLGPLERPEEIAGSVAAALGR